MPDSVKHCPVCGTLNPVQATLCTQCGADLSSARTTSQTPADNTTSQTGDEYDFRYGETDLLESSVSGSARVFTGLLTFLLVLAIGGGVFWAWNNGLFAPAPPPSSPDTAPVQDTATPLATMFMPTVTQGIPTATATYTPSVTYTPSITPTRSPCTITMPAGQSLIWAMMQCGHRSMDVQNAVLELNNLSNASQIRSGQELLIPWPTATPDPNATPTATPTSAGLGAADSNDSMSSDSDSAETGSQSTEVAQLDESIQAFADTPTPTLPAGVQWHVVQSQENIISIAYQYNADVKTLSELNREIPFPRCDFGETFGGPECLVQLFPGQRMRVPAPTPTPTLSPTPDPNATATPTPTPTYNEPNIVSPSNRAFFGQNELITLRWVPSATLRENEVYRIDVTDTTSGTSYEAVTTNISFLVPPAWQGTAQTRYEYEWTVGIIDQNNPDTVRFQTEPHLFVWQGKTESN